MFTVHNSGYIRQKR